MQLATKQMLRSSLHSHYLGQHGHTVVFCSQKSIILGLPLMASPSNLPSSHTLRVTRYLLGKVSFFPRVKFLPGSLLLACGLEMSGPVFSHSRQTMKRKPGMSLGKFVGPPGASRLSMLPRKRCQDGSSASRSFAILPQSMLLPAPFLPSRPSNMKPLSQVQ